MVNIFFFFFQLEIQQIIFEKRTVCESEEGWYIYYRPDASTSLRKFKQ